jgi:hypothetical protein
VQVSPYQFFDGRCNEAIAFYSFDETVTLFLYRLGHQVAARVGGVLLDQAVVDLVRITPEDEQTAWAHGYTPTPGRDLQPATSGNSLEGPPC